MSETVNSESTEANKPTLRDKTLKAAGWGYLFGDAAMIKAGQARGKDATVAGAATWLVGGLAAARYGNPGQQKQLQIAAAKLEHFFQQKGVAIDDQTRMKNPLLAKRNAFEKAEEFLYEHPSESLNAMYGIGAVMLLKDGIKDVQKMGRAAIVPKSLNAKGILGISSNFWMGVTILGGAIAGIFIKEDPEARKKAKDKGPLTRVWAYIKEKPLRLSSSLYMANNLFLGVNAYQDYQLRNDPKGYAGKNPKPHHFSIPQVGFYLFSNTMLFLSRRNQMQKGGLPEQSIATLEDVAAQVIVAQPAEKQEGLLASVSEYLSKQKGIGRSAEVLKDQLTAKVKTLKPAEKEVVEEVAPKQFAAKETARRASASEQEAAVTV